VDGYGKCAAGKFAAVRIFAVLAWVCGKNHAFGQNFRSSF